MQPVQLESDIPESILQELQALRCTINYEEEEDHLDTDVTMQDKMVRNTENHNLPAAPVLMVVKYMSGLINELAQQSCVGCINQYPSQKDHEDCMWLTWSPRVVKYFDEHYLGLIN